MKFCEMPPASLTNGSDITGNNPGGHVRIGDNGEVALKGFTAGGAPTAGSQFELSSVRFRIGR